MSWREPSTQGQSPDSSVNGRVVNQPSGDSDLINLILPLVMVVDCPFKKIQLAELYILVLSAYGLTSQTISQMDQPTGRHSTVAENRLFPSFTRSEGISVSVDQQASVSKVRSSGPAPAFMAEKDKVPRTSRSSSPKIPV